ncbi:MAG: hypothetical protein ABL983_22290, partial [Nitrospira sp.]
VEGLSALRKNGNLSAGVEVKISACDPLNPNNTRPAITAARFLITHPLTHRKMDLVLIPSSA